MEKEGLERVLLFLKQQGLIVKVLVTDRHKQINKWLRESYPAITHYYDVWHVAKGNESRQSYSGIPLKRTPLGPTTVSAIARVSLAQGLVVDHGPSIIAANYDKA